MNKRTFLILGRAFFILGVILGFVLSVIAIWNELEAANYYFTGVKYAPFKGLRCPLILAPTEKGLVTAVFDNPTNEEDHFLYRAEISGKAFSKRSIEAQISVPPHQQKNIRFSVDANDIDLLFFILVKITILPNSAHPSQEATCGTLVASLLGLKGSQVFLAALFLSVSGIVVGLGSWRPTSPKAKRDRQGVVQTLGVVVLLTLAAAYMGWWAVAIALTAIIILLVVISMRLAFA